MGRKPMPENELYATGEELLQAVARRVTEMKEYPRTNERRESPSYAISGLDEELDNLRIALTDANYNTAGILVDCIIYHLAHLISWTEAREPKKFVSQ
jgi:hypothetical protein